VCRLFIIFHLTFTANTSGQLMKLYCCYTITDTLNFLLLQSAYVQGDTKKKGTFEKQNKNWRNSRKKIYWQKLNHYNLHF